MLFPLLYLAAPALGLLISTIYFRASPYTQPLWKRILVSAHGTSIAILNLGLLFILQFGQNINHQTEIKYCDLYCYLMLIPTALILISIIYFKGAKVTHLLQAVNIILLLWTFLMGYPIFGDYLDVP